MVRFLGFPQRVPSPLLRRRRLRRGRFAAYVLGATVLAGTAFPRVSAATLNDWPVYGFDGRHSDFNPNTAAFTPSAVLRLHTVWEAQLGDFNTQTQPILITEIPGRRGELIVGGARGILQAYDAIDGARIWARFLGRQLLSCGPGMTFQVGIAGTAAYDREANAAYVVDNRNATPNGPSVLALHRFDPATGADTAHPVDIAPAPLPGEIDTAHTGVTLAPNGAAYAGTGSTCDIPSWRGRVAAVDGRRMRLADTFFTTFGQGGPYSGGGVWGWGGVALDDAGRTYFGAGNADDAGLDRSPFSNTRDEHVGYAEHFVSTTAWLGGVVASDYPGFRYGRASVDLDLSGTPVLFTPFGCPTLAAIQGKAGQLLFYDADAIGVGPIGRYALSASSYQAAYIGNPAYSPVTQLVYAAVASARGGSLEPPGLIAFDVSQCVPAIAWATAFGADSYALAGTPPRSAPVATAGGVVFIGTPSAAGGELWALDARTGVVLGNGPVLVTGAPIRMAPVVSGDRLWVLDNDGDLYGMSLSGPEGKSAGSRSAMSGRTTSASASASGSGG